ncbi:MAG: winged helix-turn-helix domain-containing protein, partial [Lachnospiraceae bacterium]|nr:winged helix-turn-helix domain-containing protein [Lachnospiraceae bacterium]
NKEITFEELGKELFGMYTENDRRSVMVNVSRLRKKLEIDTELLNYIETVWSRGYKFVVKD